MNIAILDDYSSVLADNSPSNWHIDHIAVDLASEKILTNKHNYYELIFCNATAHYYNDLVGVLIQINNLLRPDGLLLLGMPLFGSYQELAHVLQKVENDAYNHFTTRMLPLIKPSTIGNLLARAQMTLPVIENDIIKIKYDSISAITNDMRQAGWGRMFKYSDNKNNIINKKFYRNMSDLYLKKFDNITTINYGYIACRKHSSAQQQPISPASIKTIV